MEKVMRKTKEQKPPARRNRVRVSEIPRQLEELKQSEAQSIKGGGGAGGGVVGVQISGAPSGYDGIGEEIPQHPTK
jgi:hypothetical protein